MSKPREFWIAEKEPLILKFTDGQISIHMCCDKKFENGGIYVREVSPSYDEAVKGLVEALTKLDQGFEDYRKDGACLFCDKGDSGYSTKGPGHHDDIGRKCASLFVHEALEAYKAATRGKDE